MSSFVVEDQLINRVVATLAEYRGYGSYPLIQTIAKEQGFDLRGDGGCRQLAEAMFALNVNAVEQRYGAAQGRLREFRPLDFCWRYEPPATLIQAYKSLGCWLYQCAEGDVPETSTLYATMRRVQGEMAQEIVEQLPEYEKAEW